MLTLVGFNNLASVLGFVLTAHLLLAPDEGLAVLLLRMIGPILLGALFGFAVSVWGQRLELPSEQKILRNNFV